MYNIFFSLFLLGMLISNGLRIYLRASREDIPATPQEYALLLALAIGSMMALSLGAKSVYGVTLIF